MKKKKKKGEKEKEKKTRRIQTLQLGGKNV